jgi:polyphosphate kinase
MKDRDKTNPRSQYGIVKIPAELTSRFIFLPSGDHRKAIILLDDLVRHCSQYIFPGFEILDMHSLKLTRDAELYIDDEFSGDLVEKLKTSLKKRKVGPPSRVVYDRRMPDKMLDYLVDLLGVENFDLLKEGRYHNNFDFFRFPNFGLTHLENNPLPPLSVPHLAGDTDFYAMLRERDHMVHVPYQSYEPVIRFFEEAAKDPNVTHIKIVQYRVAKDSRIMSSLIDAVRAGKQVSVFIEVKARFDEEANLRWGELLENVGIQVKYSFPGLKVHAKIALVRRQEAHKAMLYCYLGTGNFHEGTAKIYGDYGILTSDPRLTGEVARIFSFLETVKVPSVPFEHLMVGQFDLRPKLEALIDYEVKQAKKGEKAYILLKMNSLQDARMINLLYKASQNGVQIDLIIRGICSLIPGLKGISDNIRVISIVDRYLEHARVFLFHHGGKDEIYLSSADWMVRNLSHRIEVIFPVYSKELKQEILDVLKIQLADNVKSRLVHHTLTNTYHKDDSDLAIRSQTETYYYYKRKFDQQKRELENPDSP